MEGILESKKLYLAFIITSITLVTYSLISQFIYGETLINIIRLIWKNIFVSIFIINISYFFRYLRWRYLLLSIGLMPNTKRDLINWLASFAFAATPGKIGELVRINFYKKDFKIPRSRVFSILAIEKISDLISIILICFFSLTFVSNYNLQFFIYLLFLIIFFSLIIYKNKILLKKFIKLVFSKINNKNIRSIFNSFSKVAKLEIFIISLSIGTFAWFIECFGVYKLLDYLNKYDLSIFKASFTHTASSLVGLISLIPGGVATTEFTTSKILVNFGLPVDNAIIYSFLIRLVSIWYGTILGFLLFLIRSFKKNKVKT